MNFLKVDNCLNQDSQSFIYQFYLSFCDFAIENFFLRFSIN